MTAALIVATLTIVALSGTAVVLTDSPSKQAVALGGFGVLLSLLFVVLQAPDVALSQLAVGTAVVPLMVMLTIRKVRSLR
jgi:energy-converting hydrogenase B subunit D